MYPKVKVRSQDTDDQRSGDDQIRNYSLFLNDFQSFSIYDSSSSVKEHQDVSQPLVARMPKNYVPDIIRPTTSDQKGAEKNNEKSYDDNKSNIRASPVPRPRAVLSSPGNFILLHLDRVYIFLVCCFPYFHAVWQVSKVMCMHFIINLDW
ncbi:uncharacterized protein LOC110815919 [Carica papaya]|uniref:uncharacterized protein LOC110815919 n=1 Tax=Carica papaya TaxID=3649 RepID=UPI000B8CC01F|nr:uncharacterized protein LOC110815919 [Carica papaya]